MGGSEIKLLYHTIKYLKPIQVYYRFFYVIRNKLFRKSYNKTLKNFNPALNWESFLKSSNSYLEVNTFIFLNLSKTFHKNIDWNYAENGLLWTFNLNYFDFLNQQEISVEEGVTLIRDYITKNDTLKVGKQAFPISLRGLNWVKFLSKNQINDAVIAQALYDDYQILYHNLEYHLLGNHLLENGFSLLFGAYYFKDELLYKKSIKILKQQLTEQTLNDGAHFELSPMYHQIMLLRVLDCIHLIQLNSWKEDDNIIDFLELIASKMLSWLRAITFKKGNIPMMNDSAYFIAPTSKELFDYAEKLNIDTKNIPLSDSGYRKFTNEIFELFIDVGQIGASYQPAHVHSDTFSCELYKKNIPIIVDTGTSTYEKNELRHLQRSTLSHNTVSINNSNQTQVWGGFRVAQRAKITQLIEGNNSIKASHNGYKKYGIEHTRTFIANSKEILINDTLSNNENNVLTAHYHFHNSITDVIIENNTVKLPKENIHIILEGKNLKIVKEKYHLSLGFNKTEEAIKINVFFENSLNTKIIL